MKMNKLKLFGLALVTSAAVFTSCSDYLEVKLDEQLTLDEVFSKRTSTLNYLRHIYSYLPYEAQFQMENSIINGRDADGASVAMSDESHFSWTMWVPHLNFVTGDYGPTTNNWNNWPAMYTGIEQAGIFMENIDRCPEFSAEERKVAKAEARFLRAYCYFQLFRRFGPVFIWGDQRSQQTVRPESIDRNTVDENLEFMISEIDKAIEDLPLTIENGVQMDGRLTKGAAMAAKARILLYAASPLYNGCDLYKGKLMNKDGKYLFPQTPDPEKWTAAAKAAKAVIDLNMYSLYEDNSESDPFLKAIKSYQGVQFEPWNSEIIWGYWPRCAPNSANAGLYIAYMNKARYCPTGIVRQGCSGYCPSLKLFDTYPMAESGRYPVTGYDANGDPIVDPESGYVNTGFTKDWEHPIEGSEFGGVEAHNSCIGRDARFYASILANGFYWVNAFTAQGTKMIVTFHSTGTSPYTNLTADNSKVGLLWRRFLDTGNDYQNDQWGTSFWFYYRLAEIYLNYAEACNEMPARNEAEALKYVNLIRERAGLNKLEEAYPEVRGNQALLRELLRKERMVELAFEGHRYYDCRRWMIAEKEWNYQPKTLNVLANTYENSWERTNNVWNRSMVFEPKHYFMPINQAQLNEMVNLTQNYGW